jgi:hypothetical protein
VQAFAVELGRIVLKKNKDRKNNEWTRKYRKSTSSEVTISFREAHHNVVKVAAPSGVSSPRGPALGTWLGLESPHSTAPHVGVSEDADDALSDVAVVFIFSSLPSPRPLPLPRPSSYILPAVIMHSITPRSPKRKKKEKSKRTQEK